MKEHSEPSKEEILGTFHYDMKNQKETYTPKEETKLQSEQKTAEGYFTRLEELQYPHREICHLCHRVVAVGLWVPDEVWAAVVHRSNLNAIHCLNCFIERADEKLINWSKDIQFYAVSLRSHLDDIHNGNDEMGKFHTPPIEGVEREQDDQIIKFLLGETDLDGLWYGDKPSDGRPAFWWRNQLRKWLATRKGK